MTEVHFVLTVTSPEYWDRYIAPRIAASKQSLTVSRTTYICTDGRVWPPLQGGQTLHKQFTPDGAVQSAYIALD